MMEDRSSDQGHLNQRSQTTDELRTSCQAAILHGDEIE